MRVIGALLAVCCCLSAVKGQWLETTVMLPDSLGSSKKFQCLEYDRVNDALYALNYGGSCLVVDAGTGERLLRIGVCGGITAALYIPDVNKLYVAGYYDSIVYVVDCIARRVTDSIKVGMNPAAFCYDSVTQKLYCSCASADTIYVVDVTGDTVITEIPMQPNPGQLCLNPATRKLYCAHNGRAYISVVDADADSVVSTIPACTNSDRLCINLTDNKVYVGSSQGYGDRVAIIDGTADTLRTLVVVGPEMSLAWNSTDDKVYCASNVAMQVVVLDGTSDQQVAQLRIPERPASLAYCLSENTICCGTHQSVLYLIDGSADTVRAVVDVVGCSDLLELDPERGRVWCASSKAGQLSAAAVDCMGAKPVLIVHSGMRPKAMCYVPRYDKLYVTINDPFGPVVAINGTSGQVERFIDAGRTPAGLCYSPASDRVYCAAYSYPRPEGVVVAIDPATDSVTARITTRELPFALQYDSRRNRVYCAHAQTSGADLTVIDAAGDSTIGSIFVDNSVQSMLYVPAHDKLYCSTTTGGSMYAVVVDCSTQTVLARLPIGGGSGDVGICTDSLGDKVYFATTGLAVVDGEHDSLLSVLYPPSGLFRLAYNSKDCKVYGTSPEELFIVDAGPDTLVKRLALSEEIHDVMWDSVANKVYCRGESTIIVLDGSTDSTIGGVQVGRGSEGMIRSTTADRFYVGGSLSSAVFVLRDSGSGVQDAEHSANGGRFGPYFARGSLFVRGDKPVILTDIAGRRAAELRPGMNSVSHLPPGFYFEVTSVCGLRRRLIIMR